MKGLIGFFDILGYQNFLENNSAMDTAQQVLNIITSIPKELTSYSELLGPQDKGFVLKHLVFSDTIVFTLDRPDGNSDDEWTYQAIEYVAICSSLLAGEMFSNGLPMRGVIHEGEFVTLDMCLAGKGIVEAYKLCESLNFSGLVFTPGLGDQFIKKINNGEAINDSLFSYLTPLRDGKEMRLINVNWIYSLSESERSQCKDDAENFVLKSFWAHQKDCAIAVDEKVRNTAKLIRKMTHLFDSNMHAHLIKKI